MPSILRLSAMARHGNVASKAVGASDVSPVGMAGTNGRTAASALRRTSFRDEGPMLRPHESLRMLERRLFQACLHTSDIVGTQCQDPSRQTVAAVSGLAYSTTVDVRIGTT